MIRLNYLQSERLNRDQYYDDLISFCLKNFDEKDLVIDFGYSKLGNFNVPAKPPELLSYIEPDQTIESTIPPAHNKLAIPSTRIDWESLPSMKFRYIFLVDFEKASNNEIQNLINQTMKRSHIIGVNLSNTISDLMLKIREWKHHGASVNDSCLMASLQTGLGLETVQEVEKYMEQSQNVKMNVINSIEEIQCQLLDPK